jgi:hypothetical protein
MLILILKFALRWYKRRVIYYRQGSRALDVIVNTSVFILPLGGDLFKVGATIGKIKRT